MLLWAGTLLLVGCSGMESTPDVIVGKIENGRFLYAVQTKQGQSILREFDIGTQKVVSEVVVAAKVAELLPQPDAMHAVLSTETPKGRETLEPYRIDTKTGEVTPIFPIAESFRYPALPVGGQLVYNRRTHYQGVMLAGQPWTLDRELWISDGKTERRLGLAAFVTGRFHSRGDAPFAVVSEYHDFGTSRVRLLKLDGQFVKGIDLVREVGSNALSREGQLLAMGTTLDPKVEVIETSSGKLIAKYSLKGRCVGLLFDESDNLWAVLQQADRPAYLWRCDASGPVEVAKLP